MRPERRSPPKGPGRTSPRRRSNPRQRLMLAALTPNRAAASRCVAPCATAARTRVRRSTESAFDMPAGLQSPADSLNQISAGLGTPPDSIRWATALAQSGSIFVQIGDEHIHRVRALLDEIVGEGNFVSLLVFKKTGGQSASAIANVNDFIIWYAKDRNLLKARTLYTKKVPGEEGATNYEWIEDTSGIRRPMTAREVVSVNVVEILV